MKNLSGDRETQFVPLEPAFVSAKCFSGEMSVRKKMEKVDKGTQNQRDGCAFSPTAYFKCLGLLSNFDRLLEAHQPGSHAIRELDAQKN